MEGKMGNTKLIDTMLIFLSGDQTKNRRKVETTLGDIYADKNIQKSQSEIDFDYEVLRARGLSDYIETVPDADYDGNYVYYNSFYNINSEDEFILKADFVRVCDKASGVKSGYKSGFSTYMVKVFSEDSVKIVPLLRVDLEDVEENGQLIPHTTNVNPYSGGVGNVYSSYFTDNEPAPHIHFFNETVAETYSARGDEKEKNINGNAIGLESLIRYIEDLQTVAKKGKAISKEEEILLNNSFSMPYLDFIKRKNQVEYKTNTDVIKLAMVASFGEMSDKLKKLDSKGQIVLEGLDAVLFDLKYAQLLSEMIKDGKYVERKKELKTALSEIMTKITMQYHVKELRKDKHKENGMFDEDRKQRLGIFNASGWENETEEYSNDELIAYFGGAKEKI